MKTLLCLICNVNTTLSLTYGKSLILFALKILPFRRGLLLWSPIKIPIMVILQIMLVKMFLATDLVWHFLFFLKTAMCAFIVLGPSPTFCHGTSIVLLSANPAFHQIYHHLRITVYVFLYFINFVWMFTFKSTFTFHITA